MIPFLTGNRLLTYLAWANVAVHALALALAWFGMRPGSPAFDLDTRRAYLAGQPLAWSLGWGSWMACAALQVAFYAELARHLPEHPHAARLAVTVACAGAAVDLFCDALFITVLPGVAAGGKEAEPVFLALERLGGAGGLIVANGFYVLATLILTLCLRGRAGLAPYTIEAGLGVFVFGIQLSAAGFTGVPWHAEALTGPTIGCFCVWVVLAARSFSSPGKAP
jgi:hypothetical protein